MDSPQMANPIIIHFTLHVNIYENYDPLRHNINTQACVFKATWINKTLFFLIVSINRKLIKCETFGLYVVYIQRVAAIDHELNANVEYIRENVQKKSSFKAPEALKLWIGYSPNSTLNAIIQNANPLNVFKIIYTRN